MGIRRKSRELALQSLYQSELTGKPPAESLALICEHFTVNKKAVSYAEKIIRGVTADSGRINALIEQHAANWRLERMPVIDRSILRVAVYEFRISKEVPATVAINEAIEMAKDYSGDDSGPFLNGILDAINKGSGD